MLEFLHSDIEFHTSGTFIGLDPVYRGHDGFKKFWSDFPGIWESIVISVYELRDCGERVLALVSFEAQGRDGLEVGRQMGSVWTCRDGLVVRVENFGEWARALEFVGLRE